MVAVVAGEIVIVLVATFIPTTRVPAAIPVVVEITIPISIPATESRGSAVAGDVVLPLVLVLAEQVDWFGLATCAAAVDALESTPAITDETAVETVWEPETAWPRTAA